MTDQLSVPMEFQTLEGVFDAKPSTMTKEMFIAVFGSVYEHSAWVAEQAWQAMSHKNSLTDYDKKEHLARLLFDVVEQSTNDTKLALLRAHPDLAGKAALAGEVTQDSSSEQAGAGLDQCTPEELMRFTDYNDRYKSRFGFPFIMAVKGATKEAILSAFEQRIHHSSQEEFKMAMRQVHQIARFRLAEK
ncbi:2-oxo-4-hydroxy-4-carboxy-5-ureidoimidazoline decarboxylase [Marinomonas spartinae]|uniref:2-oxo-4-hydroxy-4-carboxy-5-ureidoimidazoline decarboxylase n=1 Tax=Marinomonas spartinae TaxID=1792290 RepID=UPI001F20FB9D|nr:2-oxo-4-hydroxy-4-carboxy-5-ureidoimidazoline decarboxylase [Marinomonas spartinae]